MIIDLNTKYKFKRPFITTSAHHEIICWKLEKCCWWLMVSKLDETFKQIRIGFETRDAWVVKIRETITNAEIVLQPSPETVINFTFGITSPDIIITSWSRYSWYCFVTLLLTHWINITLKFASNKINMSWNNSWRCWWCSSWLWIINLCCRNPSQLIFYLLKEWLSSRVYC